MKKIVILIYKITIFISIFVSYALVDKSNGMFEYQCFVPWLDLPALKLVAKGFMKLTNFECIMYRKLSVIIS